MALTTHNNPIQYTVPIYETGLVSGTFQSCWRELVVKSRSISTHKDILPTINVAIGTGIYHASFFNARPSFFACFYSYAYLVYTFCILCMRQILTVGVLISTVTLHHQQDVPWYQSCSIIFIINNSTKQLVSARNCFGKCFLPVCCWGMI